jgi:hypothetical protein
MEFNFLSKLLLPGAAPLLPSVSAMGLALHLGWALLLGCAALAGSRKLAWRYRWSLCALVVVWTLLPGPLSPAYWLGLAFQSPSLSSAVLGLVCLLRQAQPRGALPVCDQRALKVLMVLGIALGWVLLLDILALLPLSFYAWGFTPSAFALVLAVAALLWLALGSVTVALPLGVLTLFALTRLPSGNLWDALLDPWLWLALQLAGLLRVWRRWARSQQV